MSGLRIETLVPAAPDGDFDAVRERAEPGAGPEPAEGVTRLLAWRDDEPVARCTIAIAQDLVGAPGRTGMVGHYEALDPEAGVVLLKDARDRLAAQDVARVLGPINGSTWARYRLALPRDPDEIVPGAGWFAGEPRNPPQYPAYFETAGFEVISRYESRLDPDLASAPASTKEPPAGIELRSLAPARFDRELEAIFALSLRAFADNIYYSPIPFAPFRAAYDRMRAHLDPELVTMAWEGAELAGFLFAFGDPLSISAGKPTRVIVKTVAVDPGHRGRGLGDRLLDRTRETAHRKGYPAAIHALMHVENFSMRMSARHGSRVFRRYGLYGWMP